MEEERSRDRLKSVVLSDYGLMIGLIAIGCVLRLMWVEDMKWKGDEIWMFEKVRAVVTGREPFPWLGMRSSAGILNPGASIWAFLPLGAGASLLPKAFASDPVSMVRGVALLNVLGIGAFFAFFQRVIAPEQRKTWLWGLTIAAVNPLMILFSRKLWAQNILPPFCFLIFAGHWYRAKVWGALMWGFVGTLVGQVHMSGFFFQAALFAWTAWRELRMPSATAKLPRRRETAWTAWAIGTLVGLLPMLGWIQSVLLKFGQSAGKEFKAAEYPEFYLQWLTMGWGLNLEHEMERVFWSFLVEPKILGVPTFLMAIAHLFLVGCALFAVLAWIFSKRYRLHIKGPEFRSLTFYFQVGAIGMGALMTLSRLHVPVYYLNILFPFVQLWVAYLYRKQPRLLAGIAIAQLLISVVFIIYVHQNGGIPDGNYGTSYRLQNYQIKF